MQMETLFVAVSLICIFLTHAFPFLLGFTMKSIQFVFINFMHTICQQKHIEPIDSYRRLIRPKVILDFITLQNAVNSLGDAILILVDHIASGNGHDI